MKDNRDQKIDLRLTVAEKSAIKQAAKDRQMSASEFIRWACALLINQKENEE